MKAIVYPAGLPLAAVADAAQIESLRPRFEGRRCLIVGSAPLRDPIRRDEDEIVIPVNGAISSVDWADVWFVNSKLQDRMGDPKLRPLHATMLAQAAGRDVGHVVFLRGPTVASEPYTLHRLQASGCRWGSWSVLDKPTKVWLERLICDRPGPQEPCSAGLLATAVALYCGAAAVRQAGFSWRPGYHYHTRELVTRRGHERADPRALTALVRRYGDRLHTDLLKVRAA